jgi:hypothetical protein
MRDADDITDRDPIRAAQAQTPLLTLTAAPWRHGPKRHWHEFYIHFADEPGLPVMGLMYVPDRGALRVSARMMFEWTAGTA